MCARCGRLKAVEQLTKHLAHQERHLQDLKRRVLDTDRQIAEHETRQHARRVQRDGEDYVQHSYLFHHSSDNNSSSGSEDAIDSLLLAVGEEALDDYLDVCDRLHEVVERLEHARREQRRLAAEIEAAAASASSPCAHDAEEDGEAAGDRSRGPELLEALRVKLTRAVAAGVLQQQQELDVARDLRVWEARVAERSRKIQQLHRQVEEQEEEDRRRRVPLPGPPASRGAEACFGEAADGDQRDPGAVRDRGDPDRVQMHNVPSFRQGLHPSGPAETASVSACVGRTGADAACDAALKSVSEVSSGMDAGFEPKPPCPYSDDAPPRSRSRSKERGECPEPPVPLPRPYNCPQDRRPVKPRSRDGRSSSSSELGPPRPSQQPISGLAAELSQKPEGYDAASKRVTSSELSNAANGDAASKRVTNSELSNAANGDAASKRVTNSELPNADGDHSVFLRGQAVPSGCSVYYDRQNPSGDTPGPQTRASHSADSHAPYPADHASHSQPHSALYPQSHAPYSHSHASCPPSHAPHSLDYATHPHADAAPYPQSHASHPHSPCPPSHAPHAESHAAAYQPQTPASRQAEGSHASHCSGLPAPCLELYSSLPTASLPPSLPPPLSSSSFSCCRDDSGLASSDSSTDSGLLLFGDTATEHSDAISETAGPLSRGRGSALTPPGGSGSSSNADPGGSYVDVSLRYGGCGELPLRGDIDLHHQHHLHLYHHPDSAPSFPFSSSSSSSSSRTVMPSRQFHGVSVVNHAEGLELCGESAGPRGFRNGWDGSEKELSDSPRAGSAEFAPRWWSSEASASAGGDSSVGEDAVPVIVTSCQQQRASAASANPPVSIISTGRGRHKGHAPDSAPRERAKTVRFADEMTSWTWCDGDDAADSSDDTGLSSLHDDDVLETLV